MGVLDDFILPGDANEALAKKNMQMMSVGDGVNRLVSGHDGGVAYSFFVHAEYNDKEAKKAGYEAHDEVEMIQWHKSRKQKPTERVSCLPTQLLEFNDEGKCIGGRYKESYDRFKTGQQAPGLPLDKWTVGDLSTGEVAALIKEGVYTVEQYAAMSEDRVVSKFPEKFIKAHERARQYVGGKEMRAASEQQATKMLQLEQSNAELMAELKAMKEQLMSPKKATPKKKTAKKTTVSDKNLDDLHKISV